jgi:hypothetical protein
MHSNHKCKLQDLQKSITMCHMISHILCESEIWKGIENSRLMNGGNAYMWHDYMN